MKYLSYLVTVSLAAGLMIAGIGLAKIAYRPTEKEVGRVVEGAEKVRHDRLMKKHGVRNTETVYVHHDGTEWYYDQKGNYNRFK